MVRTKQEKTAAAAPEGAQAPGISVPVSVRLYQEPRVPRCSDTSRHTAKTRFPLTGKPMHGKVIVTDAAERQPAPPPPIGTGKA